MQNEVKYDIVSKPWWEISSEYEEMAERSRWSCPCENILFYNEEFLREGARWPAFFWKGEFVPQKVHQEDGCYPEEGQLQSDCGGPLHNDMTGVRIGCVNCEPYVRQVTSKDSAFVYSSVFPEDLKYEVYYGDTKLDGVLEVKVGMGGYIIQVREDKYRGAHSCPCTQEVEDMRVCTAYIPGNHYRVEEPRTDDGEA